jgi:O-acetylhomoserine (thiol)-lyase
LTSGSGGAIVDAGRFGWTADADRWPEFYAPAPGFHHVIFGDALREIGNVPFLAHVQTHWFRDQGMIAGAEMRGTRWAGRVSEREGIRRSQG